MTECVNVWFLWVTCLVDWFSRHFEVNLDDSVAEKLSEAEEPWQRDSVKVGGLPVTGVY